LAERGWATGWEGGDGKKRGPKWKPGKKMLQEAETKGRKIVVIKLSITDGVKETTAASRRPGARHREETRIRACDLRSKKKKT